MESLYIAPCFYMPRDPLLNGGEVYRGSHLYIGDATSKVADAQTPG